MVQGVDRKVMMGVVLALASYAMYSLHYASMKWLNGSYSLWQLIFLRSVMAFAITIGLGRAATVRKFVTSPYKLPTALRGVLQLLSAYCFFMAASSMPLSDVTTLYSTAPLMIVLLSIVFLAERINGFQWFAVFMGLVGTAIAANPGADAALVPTLYAFGSALFWALTVIFTRKSGARESSDVQLFTTGLVFIGISASFMHWETPSTLYDWLLIAGLGLQIYLAQLFFFEACRYAPASLVGPLEYSTLVWAGLFGFLMFSEVPTPQILFGGTLVIVSGIALAMGLRRMSRKAPDPAMAAGNAAEG